MQELNVGIIKISYFDLQGMQFLLVIIFLLYIKILKVNWQKKAIKRRKKTQLKTYLTNAVDNVLVVLVHMQFTCVV